MTDRQFELVSDSVRNTADAPRGRDLYYRCLNCDSIIPSQPKDAVGCTCGNIYIDPDYIRLVVRNFTGFNVIRKLNKADDNT